jgi:hypothetical protein
MSFAATSRIAVPGKKRRSAPVFVIPRERKRQQPPQIAKAPDYWTTEPGQEQTQYFIQGKRATKPEWLVVQELYKLGWDRLQFQKSVFGGREFPAGQVLDVVITQVWPPIVVDVRGEYWHQGAKQEANDARKMMQVQASEPGTKFVVVWERITESPELLRSFLIKEVGRFG